MENQTALILTAKMNAETQDFFNHLRHLHFPPERNFLDAHITVFHKLPLTERSRITEDLKRVCETTNSFEISFSKVIFYGKGTGISADAQKLVGIRQTLTDTWKPLLSRQDLQKFRPHITIQNKVESTNARRFYEKFQSSWQTVTGKIVGFDLWRYENGPWVFEKTFRLNNVSST